MVLGTKVKFRYGELDYRYAGTVIAVVPANMNPLGMGYRVKEKDVRDHESYLVEIGGVVIWPEVNKYL